MAQQAEQKTIVLGGLGFRIITNGTVKHDLWMYAQVKAAGLSELEIKPGQSPEAFVDEVLGRLMASDRALVLLGGLLLPERLEMKDWTPQVAAEVTAHLEGLIEPQDKALVRGTLASMVVGFFQSGLVSFVTSPTSSGAGEADAGGEAGTMSSAAAPSAVPSTLDRGA